MVDKQSAKAGCSSGCAAVVVIAGVLAVVFVIVAYVTYDDEETTRGQSSLACDHFYNIAADVRAGILTDAELRDKLKEVNDDAIIGTPAVQGAATEMLAAITAGDMGRLDVAVDEMDAACKAASR